MLDVGDKIVHTSMAHLCRFMYDTCAFAGIHSGWQCTYRPWAGLPARYTNVTGPSDPPGLSELVH